MLVLTFHTAAFTGERPDRAEAAVQGRQSAAAAGRSVRGGPYRRPIRHGAHAESQCAADGEIVQHIARVFAISMQ